MDINELKKVNVIGNLFRRFNCTKVIKEIDTIPLTSHVFHYSKTLKGRDVIYDLSNYKAGIIDFEGKEIPFMLGILVCNRINIFFIKDLLFKNEFFKLIYRLLEIIKKIYLFSFSDFEYDVINKIYKEIEDITNETIDFTFIKDLKIINLQETPYESLLEAIYKDLEIDSSGDPLSRKSFLIGEFFSKGLFDLIIGHNINCLTMEVLLFKRRFVKKNMV